MKELLQRIEKTGLVPVVVLEDADQAERTAEAILKGGLDCVEITFRTDAAEESIHRIARAYPEMLLGAGTVLTTEQVDQAAAAGTQFIVSPGFDEEVVSHCIRKDITVLPGCMDTYAIGLAIKAGLSVIKFFPAEQAGGVKMLRALSGPYGMLRYIPTGGIGAGNLQEYLLFDKVLACGGSWMVSKELIRTENYDEITKLTREAVQLVQQARGV